MFRHHFEFRLHLFEPVGDEAAWLAADCRPWRGLDAVLHAVSEFFTSEDGRTGKVREFGEKPMVVRLSDVRFDGYGLAIGRVSSCREVGCPVDEATVSRVTKIHP
jgi:hypothetical protein